MVIRILLLSILLALTGVTPASASGGGGSIRIVITPETTPEDLKKYREEMEEKGYHLEVKPVFEDGKLQSVRGSVDFGSGGSGNFCTGNNFSAVILQKKWLGGMLIEVKR